MNLQLQHVVIAVLLIWAAIHYTRQPQDESANTTRQIALSTTAFGDMPVQSATAQLRPHFLCTYLYEVAGEFSAFYNADKVAVDDPAVRARRLQLCARTLLVLETGLGLLSLRTLKRM